MKILRKASEVQETVTRARAAGLTIGFVPTMGALHEGHLSLVRQARRECGLVIASIFVNPLQFGPAEDLDRYPRPFEEDCALLEKEKTDLLFAPGVDEMYPAGFSTRVALQDRELTDILCGAVRPGHFEGVTTVVARLFCITMPQRVYMGAKDYQQGVIVRRMARDLGFGLEVKLLPIVRDRDGLALSSRNRYLSESDRRRALALPETLGWLADRIKAEPAADIGKLREEALKKLQAAVDRVDYLEIRDPETLRPAVRRQPALIVLAACFAGQTRLIDNVIISL